MRKFDIKAIKESALTSNVYGNIAIVTDFGKLLTTESKTWLLDGFFIGFVSKGEAQFMVDKHTYDLKEGTLFACYPRNILEKYTVSPDIKAQAVFVSADHAGIFADKISIDWTIRLMALNHEVVSVRSEELERLENYMKVLSSRLVSEESEHKADCIENILMALLYDMLDIRKRAHKGEVIAERKYSSSENFFLRFIKMLSDKSRPFQNVNEYAAELGITSKYFSTICREITGKTASTIINEEIIRSSKILLQDRTLSIKQVSDKLNFANQSHFANFFHRYAGVSPQQYRKELV
jgi:AraC-like DNA-binding protein